MQNQPPLINPTLLFQFATNIHQYSKSLQRADTAVELEDQFAVPHFCDLVPAATPAQQSVRLSWTSDELLLHVQIEETHSNSLASFIAGEFRFWVDSRGATGNRRLTKFCTTFLFKIDFKKVTAAALATSASLAGAGLDKKSPSQLSQSLKPSLKRIADGFSLACRIPKSELPGYQPSEIPQINYFYELRLDDLAPLPASVGTQLKYEQDPGLWIRGNLVS